MTIDNLLPDPLKQIEKTWREVAATEFENGQMMTLATATSAAQPSIRQVLFKQIGTEGIHCFTNYLSRKGREMADNPQVAGLIYWPTIDIQIRLHGRVEKLLATESDQYFASRPHASQIGAWASKQSHLLAGREELEAAVEKYEKMFSGKAVPRPPHWGGFVLKPQEVQILSRQTFRLHDSFRYFKKEDNWHLERLFP